MATKTDRIRFVCEHCDYRARIPAKYDGQTIACPNCKKPSLAAADEGPATGGTVEIRKGEAQSAGDDKFRFVCGDCSYRARIPVKYAGMAIKCPGCGKPQEATQGEEAEHTGGTVEIRKVDLTGGGDRFLFQCGGCGYRARLPAKYRGQDIKCPGCGTPQTAEPAAPGPSTGSTVNISKVEAAAMTAEAPAATPGAIDLDAPGEDQVEVPVAAPVPTAAPVASKAPAKSSASSHDLPVPDEALAPGDQQAEYDPFGDRAEEEAAAANPPSAESQELLGELRQQSDRLRPAGAAPKPAAEEDEDEDDDAAEVEAAAPAAKRPAAKRPAPSSARRSGSDRSEAVRGRTRGGKGPVIALVILLVLALGAAGTLGWLFKEERAALTAERAGHADTRNTLSEEQAAHELTRGDLADEQAGHAGTRDELTAERERIAQLEQELVTTNAKLNVSQDQLATARSTADGLRSDVNQAELAKSAVERELEVLQAEMAKVRATMEKAGYEELEAFLEHALSRRR